MFSLNISAYPSACDEKGRMKLYRVMQCMQDCSELWLRSEPALHNYFLNNGMSQLLAYRQLDIVRVPHYGEDLRVTTSVYETNSLFGCRNTCIYDADNKPCYTSWGIGAFVNHTTGRLQKLPEEVQHTLKLDPAVEMEYTERRIVLPQEEFTLMPDIEVSRNDIDYNCHVNNAEYLRMAVGMLPQDFEVKRLRVEYKIAAKQGDVLTPKILAKDNMFYVVLYLDTHISTIFQFSE